MKSLVSMLVHSGAGSSGSGRPSGRLMRIAPAAVLLSGLFTAGPFVAHVAASTPVAPVVAWGRNTEGESTVPTGLSGVSAIAAGMLQRGPQI